ARLNGFDSVAIMKLDVLDVFDTLKICTSYRLNGQELTTPPATPNDLAACEPVYEEWPGWRTPTSGCEAWEDLPQAARRYLARIEDLRETPLPLVSIGPGRGQTISLRELRL